MKKAFLARFQAKNKNIFHHSLKRFGRVPKRGFGIPPDKRKLSRLLPVGRQEWRAVLREWIPTPYACKKSFIMGIHFKTHLACRAFEKQKA